MTKVLTKTRKPKKLTPRMEQVLEKIDAVLKNSENEFCILSNYIRGNDLTNLEKRGLIPGLERRKQIKTNYCGNSISFKTEELCIVPSRHPNFANKKAMTPPKPYHQKDYMDFLKKGDFSTEQASVFLARAIVTLAEIILIGKPESAMEEVFRLMEQGSTVWFIQNKKTKILLVDAATWQAFNETFKPTMDLQKVWEKFRDAGTMARNYVNRPSEAVDIFSEEFDRNLI